MRSFPNGKHYAGERMFSCERVDKSVTVRLSGSEIDIIKRAYPDASLSYAIRSMIHEFDRLKNDV